MKSIIFPLLLALPVLATEGAIQPDPIDSLMTEATIARCKAIEKANLSYRAEIAKVIAFADRVEIHLLDFSMGMDKKYAPTDEDAVFPIRPYEKQAKILQSAQVPKAEREKWIKAMSRILTSEKERGAVFCHFPIHGLRFYSGNSLLLETSICWACSNYYFDYGEGAVWEGLSMDSFELQGLFDQLMPIPSEELERFKKFTASAP